MLIGTICQIWKWRQLPWLHLFCYSQLCVFKLNAWMGVNGSNRRWIMYVLIGVMCHVNGTRFHGKWGKHQQNGRKRLITFIKGDSTQHYIYNLLFHILLGVLVLNHIISERILTSHTFLKSSKKIFQVIGCDKIF